MKDGAADDPTSPQETRALIAVDLGAESCRVSLLRWEAGTPRIELVHRFANGPGAGADGHLRWPLRQIVEGVEDGLRRCAVIATEGVRALAVDGWAVDYVRVDGRGTPLDDPFCYRDERTTTAEAALHARISPERLRAITAVERLRINTLYQLVADRQMGLASGARWLNLPEFLLHRWGAEAVSEYTNATHTQMVAIDGRRWSEEILAAAGVDAATMPRLVPPGTVLGMLEGPLAELPAFRRTELIAPACHDTSSAVAGIPAEGEDWGYLSCGTWSLVGTLLTEPRNGLAVQAENFTNLGGVGESLCFHKNVNGMWLLRQCMAAWEAEGRAWEVGDLVAAAEGAEVAEGLLDVDDPELLLLGGMPERIAAQRMRRGLAEMDLSAEGAPAMALLIFRSLAARYGEVLASVERHTGKRLKRLYVVGGGSRNALLRRLTAEATGLEVVCGAAESSTVGNFAVQLAVLEGKAGVTPQSFREDVMGWAGRLLV